MSLPVAQSVSKPVAVDAGAGQPSGPRAMIGAYQVVKPEGSGEMVDVMGGDARRQFSVLDHGFVALVDAMPRLVPAGQTADQAIVQAARVSYGQGTKKISEDKGLIRYLLRHRHTTPFEMVEFKFHIAMPIFIARQWIRHRTANVNEYSGRYSVMPDRFYRPSIEQVRKQVAELLAEEHRLAGSWRRSGGWLGVLQALALGTGWFLMVVGGGYCALAWSTGLPFGLRDPAILAAMTGLAMVTLPTALREMLGRRLATASAAR